MIQKNNSINNSLTNLVAQTGQLSGQLPTKQHGLILFAHGSRDTAWKIPFESILAKIQIKQPQLPCGLAYLELMQPDFATQTADLVAQGVRHIRVLPLFLAVGKHLRVDLPGFVQEAQSAYADIDLTFEVLPAVGETMVLQQAIVDLALSK
jgi:sirohydrochlorin cobaltochelatase